MSNRSESAPECFDVIVVGGGTSGCVIAARLSENPDVQVLLIEAGGDLVPGEEPETMRDLFPASYGDPSSTWSGLTAEIGTDRNDVTNVYSRNYNQARILGGCSSINGMLAQRGAPADYEEWERLGASGWGWDDVLPYFKRLENDWDCEGPMHGNDGPIDIRRCPKDEAPPFAAAMEEAMEEAGYQFSPDMNGFFGDCVTMVPLNNTPEGRVGAATGYLTAKVRERPNLKIVTDTQVSRLLVEDGRAVGVEALQQGRTVMFSGGEVVLCAGAIHSPVLLMRSGIGPADQLEQADIPLLADCPGVGQNLYNHPGVFLAVHMPPSSKQDPRQTFWASTLLRYSSGHEGCPDGDMQIFPANRSAWHPLGWRVGVAGMYVYKPFSKGSVTLDPDDPAAPPVIRFRLLSDDRDFERLTDCVAKTAALLARVKEMGIINDAFIPPGGQANALNKPSFINLIKATVINWIFDLPFGVRRLALRRQLVDLDRLVTDREACAEIVRDTAAGVHHGSGTCKMGSLDDPDTVVDPGCRVRGISGLRVADASIMPSIVSGNTHIPVLMIGEKAADLIARDLTNQRRDAA